MSDLISAARLRELLDYEPATGIFRWKVARSQRAKPGDIAGYVHKGKGYVRIRVDLRAYSAHRLAWLHVHGHWPALEIDHINGRKDDNRLCNLRDVSRTVNARNLTQARGFTRRQDKYEASIKRNGSIRYLGRFTTPDAARSAYVAAARASE